MAKSKKAVDSGASAESEIQQRLVKLIVKNFRSIGGSPVEIELNDIVVLVGANNVGKSSIIKAYELAMSDGSSSAQLSIDDFPNGKVDDRALPQIELHIIVNEEGVGQKWRKDHGDGQWLVRERWTWKSENTKPERQGWDNEIGDWSAESFPFGPANIANARRPEPHKVSAFDKPEVQSDEIKKLLMTIIKDKVKNLQNDRKPEEKNEYHQLIEKVKELQSKIVDETQEQIDDANKELSALISQVFPNYKVDYDAVAETNIDETINLFKGKGELYMGPEGGYLSAIEKQGSGARRTLLWTALKFISESTRKSKGNDSTRPHLLLIDEPEICLHPSAIREACNVLYNLPTAGNWQVMITTHSPIFIDFSKDNTTIVRVEKKIDGIIHGTTVFRPDKVKLDEDDKKNLKFLNLCDPYIAEFLFGSTVIVVEGDTEYTAFNYVKSVKPDQYKNIHIIRARGKATIVSLVKILNHFGSSYAVLHDSDTPTITTKKGYIQSNPAWGNNKNILEAVKAKPVESECRLLASLPNFEKAYFGEDAEDEKPYSALQNIVADPVKFKTIETLLNALIDHASHLPPNCVEWRTIEDLQENLEIALASK